MTSLLNNKFHNQFLESLHYERCLVVETPLEAGMKWFLGTYTGRFNRRHRLVGHLFSGRHKALIVDASSPGLCVRSASMYT